LGHDRPFAGAGLGAVETAVKSSYNLARMSFVIILAPEAVDDLKRLKANIRADVRAALETHLRHEPKKLSRSRIKPLRGLRRPQYRLRVGEIRIFYDVTETTVEVLAIVARLEADSWLAQFGNPA
jgi:mRNA-degrading endonuclease RelE of RelBE toxin-antitoxin system